MIFKMIKDTFLIAGALALVMILLFLSSALTGLSETTKVIAENKLTGGVVLTATSTVGLQVLFFVLILGMLYLIYKTLKLPATFRTVPRPSGISTVPAPTKLVIPKPIRPIIKEVEPIYREIAKPVRETYQQVRKVEHDIETELHEELDYIRGLLGKGEHDLARRRYKGIKR